jgi:hypothetical protein
MNRRIAAAFFIAYLDLSVASAHAGPCTDEIAQFELAVRQSAGKPDAGPFAPQRRSIANQRQPPLNGLRNGRGRFLLQPWHAPSGSMRKAIVPDAHRHSLPPGTCTIRNEQLARGG